MSLGTLAPDLAQPLVVVTAWGWRGATALATLGGVLAVASVAYLSALRRPPRSRAVIPVVALALAAGFAAPAVFSSDVYAYAAYGDLAARGADPYVHSDARGDALMAAAQWQWDDAIPACVYGPFLVDASRLAAIAFAPDARAQLDALRILACLALLACIPLARIVYGDRWAAVAIGANPLAIWSAVEGHNDAVVLAIALAGFAVARRAGPAVGAFVVALSAGVKMTGAAAALAFLAVYRVPSRALSLACAGAVAGALAIALAFLPYAGSLFAGHAGRTYLPQISLQAIWPPLGIAAALAAIVWGVRLLARGEAEGWLALALGGWLALPNPQPWYGLWFLPIAALAPRSRTAGVLLGLSLTTFLRYVPDAVGIPDRSVEIVLSLLAFSPLVLLWPNSRSHR